MSLLNPQIEEYVLKWKGQQGEGKGLDAEIQRIDGTKIGKTKTEGLISKKTSFSYSINKII